MTEPTWANEQLRRIHGGDNEAEGLGEAIDEEGGEELEEKAEAEEEEDERR